MSAEPDRSPPDFQRIYEEFHARIRRYLGRLAGPADADDLAQETFTRVSQGLEGFRGEAALATWIYRIATNVALDRARSRGFRIRALAAPPAALAALTTPPVIERDLARGEMSACVRGYVDRLPPDYRTVVLLSEIEGLSDREVADVLGLSLPAAKIRLHRARARLRRLLEQGCAFSRDEDSDFTCERRSNSVSSVD